MSNISARQEPKFPWDVVVPEDDFWNDLDNGAGRSFITQYTDDEFAQIHFDASLTREGKIKFLRDTLQNTMMQRFQKCPPPSQPIEHHEWAGFKMSLCQMEYLLGNLEQAESITREVYALVPDPIDGTKKNKSLLTSLMGILEERGKYAEAESTARECLDWIKGLKKCGPNSPQALGCMRTLVKCTWKQGRYADAHEWVKKCEDSIDAIETTDFKKYVPEEREELEGVVQDLEKWKLERSAKI